VGGEEGGRGGEMAATGGGDKNIAECHHADIYVTAIGDLRRAAFPLCLRVPPAPRIPFRGSEKPL